MAAFLTSLGSSMGMTGAGGMAGGLGNMFGNMLLQPGGQMQQAQAPQVQAPQASYTPMQTTAAKTPVAGTTYDPAQDQGAQRTATQWANSYLVPSYGSYTRN